MFKKITLAIAAMISCVMAGFAQNVEVEGISYSLSGMEATVLRGTYSGDVIIPEYIQVEGAFYDVTAVDDRAFHSCKDLESVTFESKTVDFKGVATFENCSNLKAVKMPTFSTQLGEWSFAGCSSLATINIPEGVTNLGNSMFKNCTSLTEITLPSTLTSVQIDVFANTTALTTVYLNSSSAPSAVNSPLNVDVKVVVPDGYSDGYSTTWCGAIVYEQSEFEQPSAFTTLRTYVEYISESGVSFERGIVPGSYPEAKVDAFETALMEAIFLLEEAAPSEEDCINAYDELVRLREDLEKSFNPVVEGYYYIKSAYSPFMDTQGVEMAMSANAKNLTWGALDKANPAYVFYITPQADGTFTIYNFGTGRYVTGPARASSNQVVLTDKEHTTPQTISFIGATQWIFANESCDISYHPAGSNNGAGTEGNITTYNDNEQNGRAAWYFEFVNEADLEALSKVRDEMMLNTKLEELVEEAEKVAAITIAYKTTKLDITANDEDPAASKISTNAKESREGTLASLTDGDFSGEKYFHSTYNENVGAPHFLQIALDEPIVGFEALLARRSGSYGYADAPTSINIYATNDVDAQWTLIKNVRLEWPSEGTVTIPNTQLGASYSFLRFEVLSTIENRIAPGDYTFFCLGELEIYSKTLDPEGSQYNNMPGMKEAVDKMNETVVKSQAIIAAGTTKQEDVDALRADIDAVLALFVDTTALSESIQLAETYILKTTVGEEFGQTTQEALDALQAAVNSAKKVTSVEPLVKADVTAATEAMAVAIKEFLKNVKGFMPDTWYYISSTCTDRQGSAGEDDAMCYGNMIYAEGRDQGSRLMWGLNEENSGVYQNNPFAMWKFIQIEGTDTYAVQNLGNGFYMGGARGNQSTAQLSYEPVPYKVTFLGGGQYELTPANDNNTLSLHAKGADNTVVTYTQSGYNTASSWTFVELQEEEEMVLYPHVLYNYTDVVCLPFNHYEMMEYNDDVQTLAVKKMTQEEVDGELVTTIEFYEKNEFAAGEPFLLIVGNPTAEHSSHAGLAMPFPASVVDAPISGNGLVGCLHGQGFSGGTAFSTGHEYVVSAEGVGIGAQTGVIDPSTYIGEVEGVTTAYTLVLKGLNPIGKPGDVNDDGTVNSADVVAIYNYIANPVEGVKADVNGDKDVNSVDVVAVYNIIAGVEFAKSKTFKAQTAKILNK